MFLTRDDYQKWADYINERVGDPDSGGFICAESIDDKPEVQFGGQYSELVTMMSALIYGIGYHHAKTTDQVMADIKASRMGITSCGGRTNDGDLRQKEVMETAKRLQNRDDVYDILEACTDNGSLDIRRNDDGGYNVFFTYNTGNYMYSTSLPGYLTFYSGESVINVGFEDDKAFRETIEDLMEHADCFIRDDFENKDVD